MQTYKIINIVKSLLCLVLALTAINVTAVERVTYYHNDALGSPVAATDKDGNLLWREEYEPYGERLLREDADTNNLWFTGEQEEAAFGINYFGARWYDPSIGRFMAIDPVGFSPGNIQSFNRYAYANNNPYLYVDPDGRATCLNSVCSRSSIDTDVDVDGDGTVDVTFVNNNPSNPAPPNDLKTETAILVENAIKASGVDSININSTTGGAHGATSNHPGGGAVDIDIVNGMAVSSSNPGVASLQSAAAKESNIRENFGPSRTEKTLKTYDPKTNTKGTKTVQKPGQKAKHKTHIHFSAR